MSQDCQFGASALVQMKYDLGQIDLEFAAIDGTIIRVHKAAAGAPQKKTVNRMTTPSVDPGEDLIIAAEFVP